MDKDKLDDDKAAFKLAVDAEAEQRKESLEALKFSRMGEQWPEEVKRQRERDGRPCLTINRHPSFAKQVLNDARQNRPSIMVHPVDGGDKETANILNGLIRNIQNVSRADIAYDTALESAVYGGVGYILVRNDYTYEDSFDQDILIERVGNPFSIYGDPRSKDATSCDWNSAFVVDTMGKKTFKKRWPGATAADFSDEQDELTALWFEGDNVKVAEAWWREEVKTKLLKLTDGSIMFEEEFLKIKDLLQAREITVEGERDTKTYKVGQRIISGTDILEENEWRGKYIPIVPIYGEEVNIEGRRHFHGLFKFAMDPQRMFNFWRTAATETVALAPRVPFIGALGQFNTDANKWDTANTANHAFIEYDPVNGAPPPQRQPNPTVDAGALQEALNAADDMKAILGIYDASLGARSNETSGRAIMARQREGDVSTFNFMDNLNRGIEHLGRIIVDLIPKVYTTERIIRCVKEDGSTYAVPVNQPVIPQQGQDQAPGQPVEQFQPAPEEVPGLTKLFDLTTGKYDVTVAAGPSFTSKREESAEQMMEFIRVFPQAAPLIGDLLAKNLDWPGSEEVAARLKAMLPPQANGQINQVVQQLQQQLQQTTQQAGQKMQELMQQIEQLKLANANKQGELAIKDKELQIREEELAIERFRAVNEADNARREHQTRAIEAANQPQNTGEQRPPE
jgi:hypothetical protein